MTSIKDIGTTSGFTDRAGAFHPPKGHATLFLALKKASMGCYEMSKKLKLNLENQLLSGYYSVDRTIPSEIEAMAKAKTT